MIAAGEWLFGPASSWGWRFSAALVGTLSLLMIGRIGRRLFGSTLLGTTAALLLAVDGQHFVLSRTASSTSSSCSGPWPASGASHRPRPRPRAARSPRRGRHGPHRHRAVARGASLAPRGSGVSRAERGREVVGGLLPRGVPADEFPLGRRGPARGGRRPVDARRSAQGRPARRRPHAAARPGHVPRLVDRLVPLEGRLGPAVGRPAPVLDVGMDPGRPAGAVALPLGDVDVQRQPALAAHVPVEPLVVDRDEPPHGLLLPGVQERRAGLCLRCLLEGDHTDREPRGVVGRNHRGRCPGRVLVPRPGLAGGGDPRRAGRRLAAVVPLPGPHHLQLLRGGLRAVGRARSDLLPRPAAGAARRSPDRRLYGGIAAGAVVALAVVLFAWFHPIYVAELIPQTSWQDRMWLPSWV